MAEIVFSEELKSFIAENSHVKEVHFTEDGNFHLNAYETPDGELVSRYDEVLGIKDVIVKTATREEILGEEAPAAPEEKAEESIKETTEPASNEAAPQEK